MLLVIGGLAGIATARDGTFSVGVQVVDRRPVPGLLDAIPVPPQARILDGGGHARAYAWHGTTEAAASFFDGEMPQRGYRPLARLVRGQALHQVWSDGRERVVLQLEPALGGAPLTRIRISVGPERATGIGAAGAPGPMDDTAAR